MMKKYTVSVRDRHRTSLWIEYKVVNSAFPVLLEAKNKQQAKEMAQSIIRDLGTYTEGFTIIVDFGW